MRASVTAVLSICLFIVSSSVPAQNQKEIAWKPALAYGGAPNCPNHAGSRTLKSETVGSGKISAVILGSAEKSQQRGCAFSARLVISGVANKAVRLPDPSQRGFSIVDFSEDGKKLLLAGEKNLEYPNEQFRNVSVAVLDLSGGNPTWNNAWDVFGWHDCDAMVEPQGFSSDGRVVFRLRPSVMRPPRRPDCVASAGLYTTDLAGRVQHLPDDASVQRYGKLIARSSAPCKTDPDIIAACFSVHGRLSAWNGGPTMRIWHVGTTRILGVDDDSQMPIILQEKMNWGIEAWGDFEVCPLTPERPGWMQMVCIESVDHPFFRDLK